MGESAQLIWMVPLAVLLFWLLKRNAIKTARRNHTKKIIRQRLARIREDNDRWREKQSA